MKTKTMVLLLAFLLLGVFGLGAGEVVTLAEEDVAPAGQDRLVGVLITREYLDLFDAEGYFRDHAAQLFQSGELNEDGASDYQGRLYAELRTDGDGRPSYEFAEDGIAYICPRYSDSTGGYWGASGDEAISDGHTHVRVTDEGESVELTGTVYVACGSLTFPTFYFNPVYQSGDGLVYALSGNGLSFDGDIPGGSASHRVEEESRTETGSGVSAARSSVEITITFVEETDNVEILEMDSGHSVLSRLSCAPGELPQELRVRPDTAYIVLETLDRQGEVTRTLYQRGDETLTAPFCREDGICVQKSCSLLWDE